MLLKENKAVDTCNVDAVEAERLPPLHALLLNIVGSTNLIRLVDAQHSCIEFMYQQGLSCGPFSPSVAYFFLPFSRDMFISSVNRAQQIYSPTVLPVKERLMEHWRNMVGTFPSLIQWMSPPWPVFSHFASCRSAGKPNWCFLSFRKRAFWIERDVLKGGSMF